MRVGEKVKFIHETREGIIVRVISDSLVEVRVEGGMEQNVPTKNIIVLSPANPSENKSATGKLQFADRLKELGELAHGLATGHIEKFEPGTTFDDEVAQVERSLSEIAYNLWIQKRQQAALYGVTKVLAKAEDLAEAMPDILHVICESLGWQWSAIWTIDRDAGVLRCGGMWESPAAHVKEFSALSRQYTFEKGVGLPGRVWSQGKPAWVTDVQADHNFPRIATAKEVGLHAAFCFPIHGSHGTLGVMEFLTISSEEPDNSLLAMMNAVGSQIGQFIERSLAQEMSAKKISELESLHQRLEKDFALRMEASLRINAQHAATKVLADAPGLSEATPRLLKAICEGLDWQCSVMWAVNKEETALEFVDCWHVNDGDFSDFITMSQNMNFTKGTGLPGRVWNNGEPLWILDVVKDSNFPRAKTAEKGNLHGAFAFPVRLKDRVLGVMEFFSRKVQEPDEALLAMMAAVGSQIGQFIERKNAETKAKTYLDEVEQQKRLIERQKQKVENDYAKSLEDGLRLQAQHSATKVLADAPGLSEATPQLLKAICEGLDWQCSMMWVVNEDESALEFVDCWHVDDGDFIDFITMSRNMNFTRGRGLPGRVWDNGEPLWILDVVKDSNFPRAATAEKGDLHGAFAFPVRLKNHVSGVMEFFSRKVQEPDLALLEMMVAVGSQIGQFIERKNAEAKARVYLMEVEKQKNLVEEHQKEIIDSINYAQRIQRALLASDEMMNVSLKEHFVFFQPKDIVSGDFYWAAELENKKVALVTADSTGHGVPGAIMSMLNISCLNDAVEGRKLTEPCDILNYTRNKIIRHLANDGSAEGGKDGMDCSLISFDFENNELTYSAANNPVWIVRNKQLLEFPADKMPVGKHDRDSTPFAQHKVQLQKHDMVYALTDGMPDQFGGPKGKKYMYRQLKQLLVTLSDLGMATQKEQLSAALNTWKQGFEQVDDVCIIGVRI